MQGIVNCSEGHRQMAVDLRVSLTATLSHLRKRETGLTSGEIWPDVIDHIFSVINDRLTARLQILEPLLA